jgi:UDP-glucose 4-epimerase
MTIESLQHARTLITGGLGFIGSNLARRLVDEGAEVTLVDLLVPEHGGHRFNIVGIEDRIQCHVADIGDAHVMAPLVRKADVVFNLAGQTSHMDSMIDPQRDLDFNVRAHLAFLECCRRENPRLKIVFASTRQLYGRPDSLPVSEAHPIRPVDVNGVHKYASERYHLLYNDVHGLRACAVRLTNTYGPRMRVRDARQTFLGVWIRNLIRRQPIRIFGDGSQLRDLTYVDDCVDALLAAAASDLTNGRVYNLGGVEALSLAQLAEVLKTLDPETTCEVVPFPSEQRAIDIGSYRGDFSLITRELGWTPKVDVRTGLQRTIAYYRQHGDRYWETSP